MTKRERVNVLVSSDQKERWEEYLDESDGEFTSFAQLVRRSVEKEINDDGGRQSTAVPDDLSNQLSEVIETVRRLDDRVQEMDARMTGIERHVRDDPSIKELANDLFQLLPTSKDAVVSAANSVLDVDAYAEGDNRSVAQLGTVEALAEALDEDEHQVRQALKRLQQDTHQIRTTVIDGETRYYKEG